MALKEDFEIMEESLRNALRQDRKCQELQKASCSNPSSPRSYPLTSEGAFAATNNYITVFDHERYANFRRVPNLSDDHRPVSSAVPVLFASDPDVAESNRGTRSNLEDFQRYCALLMERIRKVEEQNMELQRIAERHRMEYDKVVAQVVESEQSQRQLIAECSGLRKQVDELAAHNRKLQDQQSAVAGGNREPLSQETSSSQPANRYQSSPTKYGQSESAADPLADVLKVLRTKPVGYNENYHTPNLATIVELCAAFQLAGRVAAAPPSPIRKTSEQGLDNDLSSIPEIPLVSSSPLKTCPSQACDGKSAKQAPSADISPCRRGLTAKEIPIGHGQTTHSDAKPNCLSNEDNEIRTRKSSDSYATDRLSHDESVISPRRLSKLRETRLRRSHSQNLRSSAKLVPRGRPASLVIASEHDRGVFPSTDVEKSITKDSPPRHQLTETADSNSSLVNVDDVTEELPIEERNESDGDILENAQAQAEPPHLTRPDSPKPDHLLSIQQDKENATEHPDEKVTSLAASDQGSYVASNFPVESAQVDNAVTEHSELSSTRTYLDEAEEHEVQEISEVLNKSIAESGDFNGENQLSNEIITEEKTEFHSATSRWSVDNDSELEQSQEQVVVNDETNCAKLTSFDQVVPCFDFLNDEIDDDLEHSMSDSADCSESGKDDFIYIASAAQVHRASPLCKKNVSRREKPNLPITDQLKRMVDVSVPISQKVHGQSYITEVDGSDGLPGRAAVGATAFFQEEQSRIRTFSEGSTLRRRKENSKSAFEKQEYLRRRSSSIIGSSDMKPVLGSTESPKSGYSSSSQAQSESVIQRPRFPPTNPHSRFQPSKSRDQSIDQQRAEIKALTNSNDPYLFLSSSKALFDQNTKSNLTSEENRKLNKSKFSKRGKSNGWLVESKKSSSFDSTPTKSLVGLVKSKIGLSSSSKALSNSRKSSFEYSKTSGKAAVVTKVKNLKADPNSLLMETPYLPPGKDGDIIRKKTKQKLTGKSSSLDEISESVESCSSESQQDGSGVNKMRRSSEELLSDEGYAEGSTIERSEKEETVLRSSVQEKHPKADGASARLNPSADLSEKLTNDVSPGSRESRMNETDEKRLWQDSRSIPGLNSRVELIPLRHCHPDFTDVLPDCQFLDPALRNGLNNADVTLVPLSALNRSERPVSHASKLLSKKLQKGSAGSAFGRFKKSFSSHYGASREDLSRCKELSTSQTKESKKSKAIEHQRDMEKVFMSSVVKAELHQSLSDRSSSTEQNPTDSPKDSVDGKNLYASVGSSMGSDSIGTGSSFSSVPSSGSVSSHGSTAGKASFDRIPSTEVEPNTGHFRRMDRNKPLVRQNGISKSDSVESTVSTSDSESSFQARRDSSEKSISQAIKISSSLDEQRSSERTGSFLGMSPKKHSNLARNSKIAAPNKAVSAKSNGLRGPLMKAAEKSQVSKEKSGKTKLAPLGYGLPPRPGGKNGTKSPVSDSRIEQATNQQSKLPTNSSNVAPNKAKPTLLQPTSIRNPSAAIKIPSGRTSSKNGIAQIQPPKARSGLLPTAMQRPRPLKPGPL